MSALEKLDKFVSDIGFISVYGTEIRDLIRAAVPKIQREAFLGGILAIDQQIKAGTNITVEEAFADFLESISPPLSEGVPDLDEIETKPGSLTGPHTTCTCKQSKH